MSKARMQRARALFPLGHRLVRTAHNIADHGDGSIYSEIAAALFVATLDAEKRHRAFLAELRRRLSKGWPADLRQPSAWALDILTRLESEPE